MRKLVVTFAVSALLGSLSMTAGAQADLDGDWAAVYTDNGGFEREAEVGIKGGMGTWTSRSRPGSKNRTDPCIGRAFPMSIDSSADGEIKLAVNAADTIAGCNNMRASLKSVSATTYEGQFGNGRPLKLVKR